MMPLLLNTDTSVSMASTAATPAAGAGLLGCGTPFALDGLLLIASTENALSVNCWWWRHNHRVTSVTLASTTSQVHATPHAHL